MSSRARRPSTRWRGSCSGSSSRIGSSPPTGEGSPSAQAPLFWERVFAGDLTWVGLAFAAIGAVWLLLRRPGDALLLASGGAVVTAFAVGYAVPDAPVFVIPALLCLWLFAAAGCE